MYNDLQGVFLLAYETRNIGDVATLMLIFSKPVFKTPVRDFTKLLKVKLILFSILTLP